MRPDSSKCRGCSQFFHFPPLFHYFLLAKCGDGTLGIKASSLSFCDIVMKSMVRDFFLGFVKIHILYHAVQAPVYGVALIQELRRHRYELSPGTLYPILHGLEAAGYLLREDRVVGGRVRKYYTSTDKGRQALAEARRRISEMVYEVLLQGPAPTSLPEPSEAEQEAEERLPGDWPREERR